MRCTVCQMQIYPRQPTASDGELGNMHAECVEPKMIPGEQSHQERHPEPENQADTRPTCKACRKPIDEGESTVIGGGVLRHANCQRMIEDYRDRTAKKHQERQAEPENPDRSEAGHQERQAELRKLGKDFQDKIDEMIFRPTRANVGPPIYEKFAEPENSDRSQVQELTVFRSYLHPGLYVAIVGTEAFPNTPEDIQKILDDTTAMDMDDRLAFVVQEVIDATGTDNVAGRCTHAFSTQFKGAVIIQRQGVFIHDHALWAEFLHIIG